MMGEIVAKLEHRRRSSTWSGGGSRAADGALAEFGWAVCVVGDIDVARRVGDEGGPLEGGPEVAEGDWVLIRGEGPSPSPGRGFAAPRYAFWHYLCAQF